MTLTMIIAIIAAMLFAVFCVLCLYAIFRNQKDTEQNENRMKNIEKKLGSMTELINNKTDALESKINEQPIYNVYSDMIDVNPHYPYDTPAYVDEEVINISDILDDDFEDLLVDEEEGGNDPLDNDDVLTAFMESFKAFEEEVIGTARLHPEELEAAKSAEIARTSAQTQAEGVPPAALAAQAEADIQAKSAAPVKAAVASQGQKKTVSEPARHHQGQDTGRSGKKYTISELDKLIRE